MNRILMKELPKTRQGQKDAILDLAKLKLTYGREQPAAFFFFRGSTCLVVDSEGAGISRSALMLVAQTVILCFAPDEYVTVSEAKMMRISMKEHETVADRAYAGLGSVECLILAEATKTTRKLHMYEIKRSGSFTEFVKAPESGENSKDVLKGDFFSLFDIEQPSPEVVDKLNPNHVLQPLFETGILMTLKDYWKASQALLDDSKQGVIWN